MVDHLNDAVLLQFSPQTIHVAEYQHEFPIIDRPKEVLEMLKAELPSYFSPSIQTYGNVRLGQIIRFAEFDEEVKIASLFDVELLSQKIKPFEMPKHEWVLWGMKVEPLGSPPSVAGIRIKAKIEPFSKVDKYDGVVHQYWYDASLGRFMTEGYYGGGYNVLEDRIWEVVGEALITGKPTPQIMESALSRKFRDLDTILRYWMCRFEVRLYDPSVQNVSDAKKLLRTFTDFTKAHRDELRSAAELVYNGYEMGCHARKTVDPALTDYARERFVKSSHEFFNAADHILQGFNRPAVGFEKYRLPK